MKIKILIILSFTLICHNVSPQTPAGPGQKKYQARIMPEDNLPVAKGFLYQVSDTSVILVNTLLNPEPREYKYNMIRIIKVRRYRNVLRGTITGGALGFTSGVILVNSFEGGLSFLAIPVSTAVGLTFGLFGAGAGALAGTIRDRIPVMGDPENFNKYKGSLLDYSWMKEQITGPRFGHRGYIGAELGISFAGDEFIGMQNIPVTGYSGMSKTGMSLVTYGGYRFNEILGLDVSLTNQFYGVKSTGSSTDQETYSWDLVSFIVGPVVTLPAAGKLLVSLSPGIGYAGTSLSNTTDFLLEGEGFGWQIRGSLAYNYSKRWMATLSPGYLSSGLKYHEGGSGKAKTFHIEAGLAYKFGKKNLY